MAATAGKGPIRTDGALSSMAMTVRTAPTSAEQVQRLMPPVANSAMAATAMTVVVSHPRILAVRPLT